MVKASNLIDWCKMHVGGGYVYGTVGQTCTQAILDDCQRQYGALMGADYYSFRARKWLGKWVCDCSGLFKSARKALEKVWADVSAQGTYDQCATHGEIKTMPKLPGTFVFVFGTVGGVKRMVHVGMYLGQGKVIEARGVAYGVVITNLKERDWSHWGKPAWVDFDLPEEDTIPFLITGTIQTDKGDAASPKHDDAISHQLVDKTAENAYNDHVITSPDYWSDVLSGKIVPKPEYLRVLLDRYHLLVK